MSISPRFLDQLRSRLSLSDIIGKRIKIMRAGREYKACCPFHHEKTPSFTINDDKQFYHCFGCGAHGDVIKFVMEYDNISFRDAVESLASQVGMAVPQETREERQKAQKAKDLYELLEDTTKWFEDQLRQPQNKEAQTYIQERGLSAETLQTFRVGYAPDDSEPLRKHLLAQGYSDEQMVEAGVMRPAKKGHKNQNPYGFFRGRLMFPVADRTGRVVAFGGRILPDHLRPPSNSDFTPPKYINSSDTPVFNKGWVLYGEHIARKAAGQGQEIFVVEGYMDVIACHQAGLSGAVAPMGTALTEHQIASLWSMAKASSKTPILCFDGDNAGQRAAQRACERVVPILQPDQSVRFAFLPQGEDPDSMIQNHGRKGFENILNSAISLFEFIWQSHTAGRRFDTPEAKAGLTKTLQDIASRIGDQEVQLYYRQQIKEKISKSFFPQRQYGKGGRSSSWSPTQTAQISLKPTRPASARPYTIARILLAAAINHPHIYDGIEEEFCNFEVPNERLNALRQKVIAELSEAPDLDAQGLQQHLSDAGFQKEMGDILNESVYVHASFCSPESDSAQVENRWRDFYHDMQDRMMGKEIESGWREALQSSDPESEEKVKNLLQLRASHGRLKE